MSEAINTGDLDLESLHKLKDYEVIKELTKIKGIGVWTAEMFLIFSLKRENVFSLADLGLFNAMKALYNPLLTKEEQKLIVKNYEPYKSIASLYLWKSLNNTPK